MTANSLENTIYNITKLLKSYGEHFLSAMLSRPYIDGPTSVVHFERVMGGTRSLAK